MESKVYFNRMYLERVPDAGKKEIKEEYSKYKKEYEKMYGGEVEGNSLLSKVWNFGNEVGNFSVRLVAGLYLINVWASVYSGDVGILGGIITTAVVNGFVSGVGAAGGGKGGERVDFVSEYIEKMKGINWDKNDYFIEGVKSVSKELKKDKNNVGLTERERMDISKELDKIVKSGRDIMNKTCRLLLRSEYGVLTVGELSDMIDEINVDKKLQKELEGIL